MSPFFDSVMLLTNAFDPDVRVLKEAKSLVDAGRRVLVLAWDRKGQYPVAENIQGIRIERCGSAGSYGKGLSSAISFLRYYGHVTIRCRRLGIGVLHCHDLDTLPIGLLIARLKKCKILYDAHELEYFIRFPARLRDWSKRMEAFLSKRTDAVLVVNGIQREKFVSILPTADRVTEVRNSPVREFFTTPAVPDRRRTITLGYIGYLQKGTGIETLLRLFPRLRKANRNLRLLLVGKVHPGFETTFRRAVAENTARKDIEVVGHVPYERMPVYYRRLDILSILYDLTPQYIYNSPTKMFEAMAFGIPFVISRIGDAEEIIRKHRCGVMVDVGDDRDILQKIEFLIRRPQTRNRLGRHGKAASMREFHWAIMEQRLLGVYHRLLS
jgi:glycosyltransferase involved in cell wall biosynthesis